MGVPFEATTSFRPGTAGGPAAVLEASRQIDLFDLLFGRPYEAGIWMAPIASEIGGGPGSPNARRTSHRGGASEQDAAAVSEIEAFGEQVNERVRAFTADALGPASGDRRRRSLDPLRAIDASAARHGTLGILEFDAHADLRPVSRAALVPRLDRTTSSRSARA